MTVTHTAFVVHILAVVLAFGPVFAYGPIIRAAQEAGGEGGASIAGVATKLHVQSLGALVVAVIAGVVLVDRNNFDFGAPWISASFTVVILLIVLSVFFLVPNLKKQQLLLASPTTEEEAKTVKAMIAMGTAMVHLGLLSLIILMVWKPQ